MRNQSTINLQGQKDELEGEKIKCINSTQASGRKKERERERARAQATEPSAKTEKQRDINIPSLIKIKQGTFITLQKLASA